MTMSLPTLPPLPGLPDLDAQVRSIPSASFDIDRVKGVVEALIVPYLKPTHVTEVRQNRSTGAPFILEYDEQFSATALERAKAAPRRVGLTFTHSDSMPDRMGYGVELRDSTAEGGAVMTWQLYRDTLDRSVELLTTTHDGMSLTFRTLRPQFGTEQPGQLVTREAVHLFSVAATDDPQYTDTRVIALRERAAILEAEQQRTQQRADQYVEGLLLLRTYGRELSPAQVDYLAEHGHPAPTS